MGVYRAVVLMISIIAISSCKKSETTEIADADRTVIVYIAADNNLGTYGYADNDIDEMLAGYPANSNNNLIVYADIKGEYPQILKIEYDSDSGTNIAQIIKEYDDENSVSAEVIKERIEEIQLLYPAPSYGLVLWSHGFGWYPSGISYSIYTSSWSSKITTSWNEDASTYGAPLTKSFGDDSDDTISIDDLAAALPTNFDFIIFDACFMACAEVAYELKDNCDNLIVSTAEVFAEGFPYEDVTSLMLADQVSYDAICQAYYNLYNSYSGVDRSATISHIETAGMQNLKEVTNAIVAANSDKVVDLYSVQQMDRRATSTGHIFIDALSYIEQIASSEELSEFNDALEAVVKSSYSTPYYFCTDKGTSYYGGFAIEQNCGLTLYLPQSQFSAANTAHETISWSM